MSVSKLIIDKLFLGFTLAAPIGPVSIEMIHRGLQSGFWSAIFVRLGGCIGNTLCLIAAYFSLQSLAENPTLTHIIALLGAMFLLRLGFQAIRKPQLEFTEQPKRSASNGLFVGFVLSLANPVALVFWLGIFANSMAHDAQTSFTINLLIIVGVLCEGIALSALLEGGKRNLSKQIIFWIGRLSGICLMAYGMRYGIESIVWLVQH